jgi:hypothetical protein
MPLIYGIQYIIIVIAAKNKIFQFLGVPIFEAGLTIYPVGDRRVANQVGTDPEELELIW